MSPGEDGAFPVLAQVEASTRRTGLVLATAGRSIARLTEAADQPQGFLDLTFEGRLSARHPLAVRTPDRAFAIVLG
ncbi:hypothetical protein [Azorhizobium sp. AG788]|uniref:hypothetical protein n=1 Tax=Azorhizobium sp. AG788 TaxID=2183897 RepID=UPI003138D68A